MSRIEINQERVPDPITKLLQMDWVHTAQPIMERSEVHLVMLQASASITTLVPATITHLATRIHSLQMSIISQTIVLTLQRYLLAEQVMLSVVATSLMIELSLIAYVQFQPDKRL